MTTMKGSGSLSRPANHGPRRAPMKPRAIETISPPRTLPEMALPMAPQIAAIRMRSRTSKRSPGGVIPHWPGWTQSL